MKLLNIDYVPGQNIEALGVVKGTVVHTKNLGRDFMAAMKTLVGGELVGYTQMLNEARQIAVKRMVDEAETMGADAVINLRYGTSSVMSGAAEVIAYGTAVKFIDAPKSSPLSFLMAFSERRHSPCSLMRTNAVSSAEYSVPNSRACTQALLKR